ncbi:unnamed protein product [Rodentolepis nana]|uniref:Reverse transcriptase domain-containing protein n=1 Tax=Rodentolepis nana TaxID=102285 RepID=A0A0R3TVZ5_RODNA|nr:unnamed protein product [Rodentolepis nana]
MVAYFMQMIWYYGIPGLLYADDLVLWYSAYFTQMIWYYGIPPPRKKAKERTESVLNCALIKLLANWCDNNGMHKPASKIQGNQHRENCIPNFFFDPSQHTLEKTNEFAYLGMTWYKNTTLVKTNDFGYKDTTLEKTKEFTYLGMMFGTKLTRVWGCGRSTLNTTYKIFIQPIMLHCYESLIKATEVTLKPLEKAHNQALRLITGGIKSTPIDAILLITGNTTICSLIKEKALILYEKLLHIPMDKFFSTYENRPRHLKTQSGLIQKAIELKKALQIDDKPKSLPLPNHPFKDTDVVCCTQPLDYFRKSNTSPEQMRPLALETINVNYPKSALLRLQNLLALETINVNYTGDGSTILQINGSKSSLLELSWRSMAPRQLALSDITDWPGIEAVADWPRIEAVAEFNFGQESKPLLSLDYVPDGLPGKTPSKIGRETQLALSDITDWPGIEAVADWPRIEAVAEFRVALYHIAEWPRIEAVAEFRLWPRIEAVAEFRLRTRTRMLGKTPSQVGRGNGEDPPDVKPTGGNGEDPSDSLQEKMEKTHLIRCSKEEMEKTHLIRCLAEEMVMTHLIRCPALKTTQTHLIRCPALKTRTWSLIVKPTGGNGEDPSDSQGGNGEDPPDSVSSDQPTCPLCNLQEEIWRSTFTD